MKKYWVEVDSCELCVSEYIKAETDKLDNDPDDQAKTTKINHILHNAHRATLKNVIKFPCRENVSDSYHKICKEHLQYMTELIIIQDYNDESNRLS